MAKCFEIFSAFDTKEQNLQRWEDALNDVVRKTEALEKYTNESKKIMEENNQNTIASLCEEDALILAGELIQEERVEKANELVRYFCERIMRRLPSIRDKWEFHFDLWTEIGSLSFASRSIWWDPELKKLNRMIENKFGRVSAPSDSGDKPRVHEQMKFWLSTEPAIVEKLETVKKIAKKENNNGYSDTDSEYRDCLDFMMPSPTPPAPHIHQFTPDYDNIYNSLEDLKNYYNARLK